jgi:serine/threonine-protein kinase
MEDESDPLKPLPLVDSSSYSRALLDAITACLTLKAKARPQSVTQLQKLLAGETSIGTVITEQNNNKDLEQDETRKIDKNSDNNTNSQVEQSVTSQSSSSNKSKKPILLALSLSVICGIAYFGFTQYQQIQAKEKQTYITKQNDNKAWQQAETSNTVTSYQLYLDNWNSGQYSTEAKQRADELAAQQQLTKLNAEQRAKAERTQIISKVQQHLKELGYKTPTHGNLDIRTQKAIEAFEKKQDMLVTGDVDNILVNKLGSIIEQKRKIAIKRKDENDWAKAKSLNTLNAYKKYAVEQPKGIYLAQANNYIDDLSWALARKINSIKAYQNYINSNTTGNYKAKAEGKIASIELENTKVALTINVTPSNASIRILNAKEKYSQGVRLFPKTYEVVISQFGHDTKNVSIDLSKSNHTFNYELVSNMSAAINDIINTFVDIPAGSFELGCENNKLCRSAEKPKSSISISSFEMMSTEITFAMWDMCVATQGCSHKPSDEGWGRDNRPVINVSYNDITQQFIPWLNNVTNGQYRLPSEAEWEYAARAGSTSQYPWGEKSSCSQAHYGATSLICTAEKSTKPVKSYQPNAFGLYDMQGNVWEWVQDCWNPNHKSASKDGKARMTGDCKAAIHRGGSWTSLPKELRSAHRDWFTRTKKGKNDGFRLVQSK